MALLAFCFIFSSDWVVSERFSRQSSRSRSSWRTFCRKEDTASRINRLSRSSFSSALRRMCSIVSSSMRLDFSSERCSRFVSSFSSSRSFTVFESTLDCASHFAEHASCCALFTDKSLRNWSMAILNCARASHLFNVSSLERAISFSF